MNFDDLQKAWQAQDTGAKVTINADALLKLVRRDQKQFWRTILLRDIREVGVIYLLMWFFFHRGLLNGDWTDCLVGLGCCGVATFMVLDRFLQRRKQPAKSDSLTDCVEASLRQVNHQIWLLKNVFWWYLLPVVAPLGISVAVSSWHARHRAADLAGWGLYAAGGVLVYWFVYWLNQAAVKKSLEPRKRELETLLAGTDATVQPSETKNQIMKATIILTILLLAVLAVGALVASVPPPATGTPDQLLEGIRKQYDLPALAVVVVKDGQICDRRAVGVRKWGDPTPVTTNDVFHLGSCTKSMTATLTAMLIDEGKLRWDTTIAEVFPELKGKVDKQYERVTVEQLLHHRGGVPTEQPTAAWKRGVGGAGHPYATAPGIHRGSPGATAGRRAGHQDDLFESRLRDHRGDA